jgi:hypothetical protein
MLALINELDKESTRHKHITFILDLLVKNNNCAFININEINNNKNNLSDFFIQKYNCIPKYFITFAGIGSFPEIIINITNIMKFVCIIDDIHHAKSIRNSRLPVLKRCDIIFSSYAYEYTRWKLPQPKNLFLLPHSGAWIIDFNENPINKILISGRVSNTYEDRLFMYKLAETNNKLEILKCDFSYTEKNKNNLLCEENFYKYLNKYLCCFVDTARDYMLAKIFEICSSGSLLLTMNENIKDIFSDLGFIDNHNYISCNKENIIQKIDFITNPNNIHIINNIRKNGYELVKSNHNFINRYNMLLDILNNNDKNYFNSHYTPKTSKFNTTYYYSSSLVS